MKTKKIIIIIVVILLIALLGFAGFSIYKYVTPVTFTSNDNSFSITLPGSANCKESASGSSSYILDLYSLKDEMMLYTSKLEKTVDINMEEIINSEKEGLSSIKENVRDISETSKIDIPNTESYKYTFTYYDSTLSSDLYSEVVWIQTEKNIYIIDFEVVMENKDKYVEEFDEIAKSFKENN